jgi:hypothetical protein
MSYVRLGSRTPCYQKEFYSQANRNPKDRRILLGICTLRLKSQISHDRSLRAHLIRLSMPHPERICDESQGQRVEKKVDRIRRHPTSHRHRSHSVLVARGKHRMGYISAAARR